MNIPIPEFLRPKGDKSIWFIVVCLAMFSIAAVYSSSQGVAMRAESSSLYFTFFRHAIFLFGGLIMMFAAHKVDYNYYSSFSKYLLFYVCGPLLLYAFAFGTDGRWIYIPGTTTTFQPSELAKFVLIMYLAREITLRQKTIKNFKDGLLPILAPVVAVTALVIPSDFSTAMLILITSFVMMIIGRVNYKYTLGLLGIGVFVLTIFFSWLLHGPENLMFGSMKRWKGRLATYQKNVFSENRLSQISDQEKLAYTAIANGGFFGQGPGKGQQKNFLPEAYSDFIFAIIIEEYGLIGGMMVVLLYLLFFYRCIIIFIKSPGTFGGLLAISLALSLVIQAYMNIMVTVGLLPVTGVTLPLISRGGTSIMISCLAIGVILSVDYYFEKHQPRKKKKPKELVKKPQKPKKKPPKNRLGGLTLGDI